LRSGMPKRITARIPASQASRAAFTASSTESWNWPGIEAIGLFSLFPGRTKSGRTRSAGESSVSRTRRRRDGEPRRRRRRVPGKVIRTSLYQIDVEAASARLQVGLEQRLELADAVLVDEARGEVGEAVQLDDGVERGVLEMGLLEALAEGLVDEVDLVGDVLEV